MIGYCPQPNLIFDYMSVEEHLYYYAKIKGIPQSRRKQLVEQAISQLSLQEQRKKAAGTLSGGNKRKLCVAQAILGNPPIILLDEPSAGMDPEARRFMWQVIETISKNKSSAVVLTTHSMEEAEALSTKMGIMVKGGVFKCFGSAQHIKNKFGKGYIIEIKIRQPVDAEIYNLVKYFYNPDGSLNLRDSTAYDDRIIAHILSKLSGLDKQAEYRELNQQLKLHNCIDELCDNFGDLEVIEQYGGYMCLRVQKGEWTIGKVFGLLEDMKRIHDVDSYSVGQTTLEQIFQSFADEKLFEKITKYAKKGVVEDRESQLNQLCIVE